MDETQQSEKAEVLRIAALIEENASTIAEFAADKERAVLLTALCLRLGHLPTGVAAMRTSPSEPNA